MSRLVTCHVQNWEWKQALYICNKIQVIYFSKAVCIDVGILPPCFLWPMTSPLSVTWDAIHPGTQPHKTDPPPNKPKFDYPKTPPYLPTSENIQNLKKWQLDQFVTTVLRILSAVPCRSSVVYSPWYIIRHVWTTFKYNI